MSEYGIERGDVLLSLQLTLTREEEERISPSPPHANGGHRPAASPPAPRQATARVSNGGPAFRPNFPSLPAAPSKPLVMLDAATGAGTLDALRRDLRLAEAAREGRRGALVGIEVETLDLVVLAAEWGHGRRRGWLSNLHLGARGAAAGDFVMLGKTFKGMTDEMLAWQTERFLELETSRDAYTVYVRPEVVVEVAIDGVQSSPRYPAGMALRFARIKGYRPDKRPEDADTIGTVRAIHAGTGSL